MTCWQQKLIVCSDHQSLTKLIATLFDGGWYNVGKSKCLEHRPFNSDLNTDHHFFGSCHPELRAQRERWHGLQVQSNRGKALGIMSAFPYTELWKAIHVCGKCHFFGCVQQIGSKGWIFSLCTKFNANIILFTVLWLFLQRFKSLLCLKFVKFLFHRCYIWDSLTIYSIMQ